jgi:hypothetical protein
MQSVSSLMASILSPRTPLIRSRRGVGRLIGPCRSAYYDLRRSSIESRLHVSSLSPGAPPGDAVVQMRVSQRGRCWMLAVRSTSRGSRWDSTSRQWHSSARRGRSGRTRVSCRGAWGFDGVSVQLTLPTRLRSPVVQSPARSGTLRRTPMILGRQPRSSSNLPLIPLPPI